MPKRERFNDPRSQKKTSHRDGANHWTDRNIASAIAQGHIRLGVETDSRIEEMEQEVRHHQNYPDCQAVRLLADTQGSKTYIQI